MQEAASSDPVRALAIAWTVAIAAAVWVLGLPDGALALLAPAAAALGFLARRNERGSEVCAGIAAVACLVPIVRDAVPLPAGVLATVLGAGAPFVPRAIVSGGAAAAAVAAAYGAGRWAFGQRSGSLQAAIDRDGLTGLYNKRFFHEHLSSLLGPRGRGSAVSLVIIDVDNFKKYNDTFDHLAGDDLLIGIAAAISAPRVLRSDSDRVCRMGGDEFAVIVPNLHRTDMPTIVERLNDHLQAFLLRNPRAAQVQVNFSIGWATSGARITTVDELIREADAEMYRQKALHKQLYGTYR